MSSPQNQQKSPSSDKKEHVAESQTTKPADSDPCKDAKDKLAASEKLSGEYLDQLRRLQAEFENFMKRTRKDQEEVKARAGEKLLIEFASFTEDLDRAISQAPKGTDVHLKDGLHLILKNMRKLLDVEGVKEMSQDKLFDPHKHDALLTQATDSVPEGTIMEVLQKGYTIHGRVLRHARVKIAKATQKTESKANNTN